VSDLDWRSDGHQAGDLIEFWIAQGDACILLAIAIVGFVSFLAG